MTDEIDNIYNAMGDMLIDLTKLKSQYLFEGMKRLHYRMDGLSYLERLKFVKFWSYLAELYHSHRYDITSEYDEMLLWRVGDKHTDSIWIFLLSQCILLSKEIIEKNIKIHLNQIDTSHVNINNIKETINLISLYNLQRVQKPGLYLWNANEFAEMLNIFMSNYQQLRLIALHYTSEQKNYINNNLKEIKMSDIVRKDLLLSILNVIQQNNAQGNSPIWLQLMYTKTLDKLNWLQNDMFQSIEPAPITSSFQMLTAGAWNKKLVSAIIYGLIDNFDSISIESITWQWDINKPSDKFVKCSDGTDLKNHGLDLKQTTIDAQEHNRAVDEATKI
jgi:hypothetical protein